MKKEKGSTMALPKSYWTQRDGKPLSINGNFDTVSLYQGFFIRADNLTCVSFSLLKYFQEI